MAHLTSEHRSLLRLVLLIATPLLLSVLLSAFILSSLVSTNLDRQAGSFGQVIADQLALSAGEYLLANDLLSLNVMLTTLVEERHLLGASVYSADNRLLVEAGRSSSANDQVFTAEIHYQDSIAGFIRVSLDQEEQRRTMGRALVQIIVLNALLLLVIATVAWRFPDLPDRLLLRTTGKTEDDSSPAPVEPRRPARESAQAITEQLELPAAELSRDLSVLVIKLKPGRLAGRYAHTIAQAISLHQGELVAEQEEEWTAHFRRGVDHCFHAICAGLLIRLLTREGAPRLTFSAGVHCAADVAPERVNSVTKQAIYLASLGSGSVLAGERPARDATVTERAIIRDYHSSLAPESRVYSVESLREPYQTLITRQAARLQQESPSPNRGRTHRGQQ